MEKKKLLIIGFLAILIIAGLIYIVTNSKTSQTEEVAVDVIKSDPIDTAVDFYDEWLRLTSKADTTPYAEGMIDTPVLTEAFKEKLLAAQGDYEAGLSDPVLCRTELPTSIRSKEVSRQAQSAQILVLGPRKAADALALVKLVGEDGQWKINDVSCEAGETAPEIGEFNFEREGFLLKDSVPPPLNSDNWHLVYEDQGLQGLTAELTLRETTVCTNKVGESITCGSNFFEAMKVAIKGNVSEVGLSVVEVVEVE